MRELCDAKSGEGMEGGEGSEGGERIVRQVEVLSEQIRGELVLSVRQEVWEEAAEDWKWALVLRLLVEKRPNIQLLASTLKRAWRISSSVEFMEVGNGRVVAKFTSAALLRKVEEGAPWTLSGMAVPMARWSPECIPEEMRLDKVKVWVQIYNIPLVIMREDIASDIARALGRVCGAVELERQEASKRRFVRVRVELDVNRPLRAGCFLERPGGPVWLVFKYERLPLVCHKCGVLNHSGRGFGAWLRADNEVFVGPSRAETVGGDGGEGEPELTGEIKGGDDVASSSGGGDDVAGRRVDIVECTDVGKPPVCRAEKGTAGELVQADKRLICRKGLILWLGW